MPGGMRSCARRAHCDRSPPSRGACGAQSRGLARAAHCADAAPDDSPGGCGMPPLRAGGERCAIGRAHSISPRLRGAPRARGRASLRPRGRRADNHAGSVHRLARALRPGRHRPGACAGASPGDCRLRCRQSRVQFAGWSIARFLQGMSPAADPRPSPDGTWSEGCPGRNDRALVGSLSSSEGCGGPQGGRAGNRPHPPPACRGLLGSLGGERQGRQLHAPSGSARRPHRHCAWAGGRRDKEAAGVHRGARHDVSSAPLLPQLQSTECRCGHAPCLRHWPGSRPPPPAPLPRGSCACACARVPDGPGTARASRTPRAMAV